MLGLQIDALIRDGLEQVFDPGRGEPALAMRDLFGSASPNLHSAPPCPLISRIKRPPIGSPKMPERTFSPLDLTNVADPGSAVFSRLRLVSVRENGDDPRNRYTSHRRASG